MYDIKNVKISIKAKKLILNNNFLKRAQFHKNFYVIKDKYTYIIFYPKDKEIKNFSHINITKIECLSKINDAILYMMKFFSTAKLFKETLTIDNITATCYFNKNILLSELFNRFSRSHKIQYNNDVFPGLQYKTTKGTAIIFHNGTVNIVGCKSRLEIEKIISTLKEWIA